MPRCKVPNESPFVKKQNQSRLNKGLQTHMKNFISVIFLLSSCISLSATEHKFILPKGLVSNIQNYIDPKIDPYTFFENHDKYSAAQKKRVVYRMLALMKRFAKEENIDQKTVDESLKVLFYKSFEIADSDIADEIL